MSDDPEAFTLKESLFNPQTVAAFAVHIAEAE